MTKFPTITETFVLYEILELERLGLSVEIFPVMREVDTAFHPEAQALVERAHYQKFFAWRTLADQFHWLIKRPLRFLKTWVTVVVGNLASPKFLGRTLAVTPLAMSWARKVQALDIEHVHAHFATHAATIGYVIHQLTDVPYSITAHAHDIYVDRSMLVTKLRAAAFIVTISDHNRRLLEALYGPTVASKVHVIHCGVDTNLFEPAPAPDENELLTIVCVAGLREMKGQRYLVEACRILKAQGVGFECLLVGEGEGRPLLEDMIARYDLAGQVMLLGAKPRPEVSEIVQNCDIFVLPSVILKSGKMEGIPVSLMEAMAAGKPVISTEISGIPELIEHQRTGLLIPEHDAEALAAAIMHLAEDTSLRQAYGAFGRQHVLNEFDLEKNTHQLFSLFANTTAAD